jgi:hypothetical protein
MADETGAPVNPQWPERQAWELEQRLLIRQEYEQLFKVWKGEELIGLKQENENAIKEGLQKYWEEYQKSLKPPTHEEIQELLNQEYEEFTIALRVDGEQRIFTIRELPQEAELQFFKLFQEKILEKSQSLSAFAQESIDKPFEEVAKAFLDLFNQLPGLLSASVKICLNYDDSDKTITKEWIQKNISSDRQWRIAEAQVAVNRLKDFFSRVSRSGQATQTMMTGQNFPQLQQLVR